jgi:hypothetical protein
MICKNCSVEIEGNYCYNCGQKASTKRFDTKIVLSELIEKLMPFEKGVLFTSLQLIRAPGSSMREYLAGKRMNYTKPLSYTLLVFAFSLIFLSQQDFQQGMQHGYGAASEDAKARMGKVSHVLTSNMTLIYGLLIPFLALASKWLFRKQQVNYAEYLVIGAYYSSGSILVGMPVMVWAKFVIGNTLNSLAMIILSIIYLGYFIWAYTKFFKESNAWLVGLKAFAVYLIAYIMYMLFIGIVAAIGMVFAG